MTASRLDQTSSFRPEVLVATTDETDKAGRPKGAEHGSAAAAPTAEETKAIDEQIASDPDDFELDDAWFEGAKTTQELFPEAYERAVRQKETLRSGLIQLVTVTLDRETIAWFKAQTGEDGETGGTRWLGLVAQALRDHASSNADREIPSPPPGD